MAVPGWPELAACGASMARPRLTLIRELFDVVAHAGLLVSSGVVLGSVTELLSMLGGPRSGQHYRERGNARLRQTP